MPLPVYFIYLKYVVNAMSTTGYAYAILVMGLMWAMSTTSYAYAL
ncbi:hypothetical protein [Desmonostoc muscorum]|nr:hypothetical protein [Desmonostoc muscorum]